MSLPTSPAKLLDIVKSRRRPSPNKTLGVCSRRSDTDHTRYVFRRLVILFSQARVWIRRRVLIGLGLM